MASFFFSAVYGLTLGSFVFLWHAALSLSLIYKLYLDPRRSTKLSELSFDEKALQISAIAALSFLSLGGCIIVIINVYRIVMDDPNIFILRIVYIFFMALSYISTYIFLVCRLYAAHKSSVHEIKKCIIYTHVIIGVSTMLFLLAFIVLALRGVNPFYINVALVITCILPNFCAFVHLFYSFNYGLFRVVLLQRHSVMNDSIKLSDVQLKLMVSVRRHTVIAVVSMLFAFVGIVAYLMGTLIGNGAFTLASTLYPGSEEVYNAVLTGVVIGCFCLSAFVMYLGFAVNEKLYLKLCKSCDTKTGLLCDRIVQRSYTRSMTLDDVEL